MVGHLWWRAQHVQRMMLMLLLLRMMMTTTRMMTMLHVVVVVVAPSYRAHDHCPLTSKRRTYYGHPPMTDDEGDDWYEEHE